MTAAVDARPRPAAGSNPAAEALPAATLVTLHAAAAAGVQRTAPRAVILGVCCVSLFMTGLDTTIVTTALPSIGASLHAGISGLQWITDAYTVVLAGLLISAGTAADRVGRRTVFQTGLSVFVAGSWLCSLAPSLGWLIAFRILQAAGGSMLNPSALGIITATFPAPASRARAIGVWDAVYGLALAAGPVLGGAVVHWAGWRAVFWVNIPVGLAAISLTALLVPDTRGPRSAGADPVGQGLIIVMLSALTYAIIEGPAAGWLSPQTWLLLALTGTAAATLRAWEPRQASPLIDWSIRSLPLARAVATAVCAVAAIAGFLFLSALYLQDVRGMTPMRAGLELLPMPAAMAACAPLAARILARHGPRIPLAAAGAVIAGGCLLLSRCTATTPGAYLITSYVMFGAGAGLIGTPVTYVITSALPAGQAARASGFNSSSRQVGQSIGIAVTGAVISGSAQATQHPGLARASGAAWLILAACGAAVLALALPAPARPAASRRPGATSAHTHGQTGRHRAAPRQRRSAGSYLLSRNSTSGQAPHRRGQHRRSAPARPDGWGPARGRIT